MIFLDAIRRRSPDYPSDAFPFSIPAVRGLGEIHFTTPVTFLVGENGCGKSTLLEAMAAGMSATAIGSADIRRDETLASARALAAELLFVRRRHAKRRTFFRAEDAFGFTKRVTGDIRDLADMEQDLAGQFEDGSYAQRLATGVARGQRGALVERYGDNPDGRSHGESFLDILDSRIVPKGLYLLDEPETPLSPTRILSLMALLKRMVAQDCQFIVATHSPILMALPDARILAFDGETIAPVDYDDTEHVAVTRAFLNNPERFLRRL